jgi:hypothetical protein
VRDDIGPEWPLEHYGVVARHLGQFSGAYLAGRPIPSQIWLSREWLRNYVATWGTPTIAQLQDSLEHPLLHGAFRSDVANGLFRLWAERDTVLDALGSLPQTLCHIDAFRRNLFVRRGVDGGDQTLAIDWADAGIGAIGEEIVRLVSGSLAMQKSSGPRPRSWSASSSRAIWLVCAKLAGAAIHRCYALVTRRPRPCATLFGLCTQC